LLRLAAVGPRRYGQGRPSLRKRKG
jgi:hypothetical protein